MARGTKVKNQKIYSPVVYGGEASGDDITIESSLSGSKGPVRCSGSLLELIIAGQIGQILHTNTLPRIYSLPDNSGTLFCSGYFTAANQLVTSSGAGVFSILSVTSTAALIAGATGTLSWATGTANQVLSIQGGVIGFFDLPDNGTIAPSLGNTLPLYAAPGPGNDLVPLTTVNNRVLLSSTAIAWALITAPYLSGVGGTPLGNGTLNQVLTSLGDGNFAWSAASTAIITPGTQYYLPFYSATTPGSTIAASSFINTDETTRALKLGNLGRLRFYEATINGTEYIELKAASALASSTSFTLPTQDGATGASLVTDGAGNLSFVFIDNGTVASGLQNQLTYYAASGNDVQGLTTVSSRVLASPLGVPSWVLITAPYLSDGGGLPLGNGTANQVLVADGTGSFAWATATTLTGEVLSGQANFVAYYPNTGTKVDDSAFVSVNEVSKYFNLLNGAALKLFQPILSGGNCVTLLAPTGLTSSPSFVLPGADGSSGQVLATDGAGNLSFTTGGSGTVNTGVANTLAYYAAATNAVSSFTNIADRVMVTTAGNIISWLLLTTKYLSSSGGLPLGTGALNEVLASDGTGNFVWVSATSLVGKVDTGVIGRIAYYSAATTVNDSAFLNNNVADSAFELINGGFLRFINSTFNIEIKAPTLASSTTYTLPPTDGISNQVISTDGAGNLGWIDATESLNLRQKGNISVEPGADQVTVIFPLAFTSAPKVVDAQWAMTNTPLPAFMPTIAIDQTTFEGFVVQLSTNTPLTAPYTIYWEAYRDGTTSLASHVYFLGGEGVGGLLNTILGLQMDLDTLALTTPSTLSTNLGYGASTSSETAGRILGGAEAGPVSVTKISSFTYATETASLLVATLSVARSSAAGVGTRVKGFVAGGETIGSGALSSIEKIIHATDTVSTVVATLVNNAVARGAAHSATKGYIVTSTPLSVVETLDLALETTAIAPNNFGTPNIQAGCNDTFGSIGYFAKGTGTLYSYDMTTDTITTLPVALTSGSGISGAGNSMRKGYFAGTTLIEALDFRVNAVSTVNTLPDTYPASSTCAVQSQGLL